MQAVVSARLAESAESLASAPTSRRAEADGMKSKLTLLAPRLERRGATPSRAA